MQILYGSMEGGGTKFVCAVGTGPEQIVDELRFPTTTPAETLERAIDFFKKYAPAAIGLAPFGPLDLKSCFSHLWFHNCDTQARLEQCGYPWTLPPEF